MNIETQIGIIAHDLRNIYAAEYLASKGFNVNLIYLNSMKKNKSDDTLLNSISDYNNIKIFSNIVDIINLSNIIVTPIPFTKINDFIDISQFIQILHTKSVISSFLLYAGYVDSNSQTLLEQANINYIDYSKSESLAVYNSIATAEGIIAEAIINKNTNLHGSNVLVLGYGKCAKTLALKLKGLNTKICVCARRKEDLILANSQGYSTASLHNLIMKISGFDYIFNTIPMKILDKELLKKVSLNALILDIASMPGGVDKEAADKYGIKVIHSLGIPGKYAPKSSGIAIAENLLNTIQ